MQNNKIKSLRIEAGLSQYELAAATDIPRWKLQLFEQGLQQLESIEIDRVTALLGSQVTVDPDLKTSSLKDDKSHAELLVIALKKFVDKENAGTICQSLRTKILLAIEEAYIASLNTKKAGSALYE